MPTLTTDLTNQYQTKFSKTLLQQVTPLLKLAEFAKKYTLPSGIGATTIRMYRRQKASKTGTGAAAALTEGTAPTARRAIAFTPIDVPLAQYGQVFETTDVVTATALLDILTAAKDLMAEEAALLFDTAIRDKLVHPTTGLTKRYAAQAADFAALSALTQAQGKLTPADLLRMVTTLKNNQAPKLPGDCYVCLVPPAVASDILNSAEWREVIRNQNAEKYFKGEIGMVHGARIVETLNTFRETTGGVEGTEVASPVAADIYSVFVVGAEAYGVVDLADKSLGSNPNKPAVFIMDKPDKSDPLNQKLLYGWKAYFGTAVLNAEFGITLRCKSEFNG